MTAYEQLQQRLLNAPKKWLVTGAAGFIGSNLVETLLKLNQTVVGLDNFVTGRPANLEDVRASVTSSQWQRFGFVNGDVSDLEVCRAACPGADFILHQAGLGSVPRSIKDPCATNAANVTGFLNVLVAAGDNKIKRVVFASSSSVYGDHPGLPKVEEQIGRCLSPYALTKYINELYADVFARTYGLQSIGLRYFNVFGPRQDPDGPYAAVIPKWIDAMIKDESVIIYGNGETSRDFCYVENAVQANLLAATTENEHAINRVFNVAVHAQTSLNQLFDLLRAQLAPRYSHLQHLAPVYKDFRPGDVRHSLADISSARNFLGYEPTHTLEQGLEKALSWYLDNLTNQAEAP
jgi:UDP-N-acetylglucosamine 4-epimerase